MAHPNEELVRSAFDAFANGDTDTLRQAHGVGKLGSDTKVAARPAGRLATRLVVTNDDPHTHRPSW